MTKKLTRTRTDRLAPGHAYIYKLGSGIQWTPAQIYLWDMGKMVESAAHNTHSAYEYFHGLCFAESFPSVTHWWFRSAWTQKVRLTGTQGLMDNETAWGYMQFIDESVPAQVWTASVMDGEQSVIFAPFPPNEIQPVNIPLRLALAQLVAGVIADRVARDEWLVITSLVHRDDLEKVFPITRDGFGWQLEGVNTSLRDEFCRVQGIKQ
jgi:hypothetical protein